MRLTGWKDKWTDDFFTLPVVHNWAKLENLFKGVKIGEAADINRWANNKGSKEHRYCTVTAGEWIITFRCVCHMNGSSRLNS